MKNKVNIFLAIIFLFLSCSKNDSPITYNEPTPYMDDAREMFEKVWDLYRVPKYELFSEYYPHEHRPDLSYFDDGIKQTQEVSYLWPMSGVFSSAVLLAEVDQNYRPYVDSMVTAIEMYYDDLRTPAGYQAYPVKFGKVDRYYDDNGLVGIDYIDTYKITKNQDHLEKAKQVIAFILSGSSPDFGGSVWWVEGTHNQKPACSNGKAMVLAMKIYEVTGDDYYLTLGQRLYDWACKYLEDTVNGVVWNSWLIPADIPEKDLFTYNTGTLIQTAVRLYKATGEDKYLKKARFLAAGSHKVFFKYMSNGTPYIADLPWFNLVLFRGYHELYEVDGNPKYVDEMIRSLDWAMSNARDNAGLVYNDWTGRTDEKVKPKWLLDASCIPEFLTRAAIIKGELKQL